MASAIWPSTGRKAEKAAPQKPEYFQLQNRFFSVQFDLATGRFNVWRGDDALWVDAFATASLPNGSRSTAEAEYAREIKVADFNNALGHGKQLIALCFDARHQLNFEVRLSLYEDCEAMTIETIVRNISKKPLLVGNVTPMQTWAEAQTSSANLMEDSSRELKPGEENKSCWNLGLDVREISAMHLAEKSIRSPARHDREDDTPRYDDRAQQQAESQPLHGHMWRAAFFAIKSHPF